MFNDYIRRWSFVHWRKVISTTTALLHLGGCQGTTTSHALDDIPPFHDGDGACCGNAGPIGGTGGGTCMGIG